jgi:acyl-CoA synthetase (AMP-forming)/AMP-acid ligase II
VLIDLLAAGARARSAEPIVVSTRGTVTYAECLARAERFAAGFEALGITRCAVLVGDPADLVAVLCGASAVGVEPCVYPTALDEPAVVELAADFDHDTVVVDGGRAVGPLRTVHVDTLAEAGTAPLGVRPAVAPVLILTTGTTGRPKGARHDWNRLVPAAQSRAGAPEARWLLAYNLNQFAGIQMLLHVLASGATLVVPDSNQPRDALRAMVDLSVTHASATPTFWRVLVNLMGESAGEGLALEQITLGGEAVPAALLDAIHARFPRARVSQVYASTEFGSSVAVGDASNGLPVSVLERGDDAPVQFRIVDDQLEVRSRVGMLGYYGADDVDTADWRPTGDLVEVRDGRIHFVGRVSEVINVGGVKVHPLPVEAIVSGVDGVAICHVYGRNNPLSGQIVAVDVVAEAGVDTEQLDDAIRVACESRPAAAPPRRIRFVDELDVRENKVTRRSPSGGEG